MDNNVLYLAVAVLIAGVVALAIAKRAKLSLKHGKSTLSVAPGTEPVQTTSNAAGIKAHGIEAGRTVEATARGFSYGRAAAEG